MNSKSFCCLVMSPKQLGWYLGNKIWHFSEITSSSVGDTKILIWSFVWTDLYIIKQIVVNIYQQQMQSALEMQRRKILHEEIGESQRKWHQQRCSVVCCGRLGGLVRVGGNCRGGQNLIFTSVRNPRSQKNAHQFSIQIQVVQTLHGDCLS